MPVTKRRHEAHALILQFVEHIAVAIVDRTSVTGITWVARVSRIAGMTGIARSRSTQMVDAALVLRQMEAAGTRLNLVMLDACRNNPFASRGLRASGGGLAQMQAPKGTLISFATQPGNVAQDGSDGHSPYTRALADIIKTPGLEIFQTFNRVGLEVKRATGGSQQPWLSSSPIEGVFYFKPAS